MHTPVHLSTVSSELRSSNNLKVLLQARGLSFEVQALRDRHLLHTNAQYTVSAQCTYSLRGILSCRIPCAAQSTKGPTLPGNPTPANKRCSILHQPAPPSAATPTAPSPSRSKAAACPATGGACRESVPPAGVGCVSIPARASGAGR